MRRLIASIAAAALLSLGAAAPAQAAPVYDVDATWAPTNLKPGETGMFVLQVRNLGDSSAEKAFAITDELPAGVKITGFEWKQFGADWTYLCSGVGTEVASCVLPSKEASLLPKLAPPPSQKAQGALAKPDPTGYLPALYVEVEVEAGASGVGTNTARVSGGGAVEEATDVDQITFSSTPAPFDVVEGTLDADVFEDAYPSQETARYAGDHPFEQRFEFDLSAETLVGVDGLRLNRPSASLRTVEATLPRGMIGNPESVPKCDPLLFVQEGVVPNATRCPANTQVGYVNVASVLGLDDRGAAGFGNAAGYLSRVPIYNLEPPAGTPVDLAFNVSGVVQVHIFATLDPAQNYAIKAVTPNISAITEVLGSQVTIWGVPGDPAHDKFRYFPEGKPGDLALGAPFSAPLRPFYTNPMDCGFDNGSHGIRIDSYQFPGKYSPVQEYEEPLNVSGCEDPRFRFEPKTSLQPTSKDAGAPVGLEVHLEVPQRNDEVSDAKELYAENGFVKGVSTPPMKKVVVEFPEGMTVNPAAAQGLGSCSPEQIGLGTDKPVTCPDSSQYGTLTLHTPALPIDKQPRGFLYIAKQNDNPFHNFLSLYLVIEQPETGILVKLPGRVDLDPVTGQITTTFDELPQFPVADVEMNLKGGLRAGLVNPQTCGKKAITATFYPWHDRDSAHTVTDSYEITGGPGGTSCPNNLADRPFEPDFQAGTTNPLAGAFSPMEIAFSRQDTDQELAAAAGTAPQGLTASLRGIGRCSDAQIAQAANSARTGRQEIAAPSCPAESQVGTVDAGAGVGQVLSWVRGKVYLAGPYKGAPASGVAIVPAAVGPFDLGVVVTRAPAYLDPVTAQLRIETDPLPQIFKGVPVRVRDVRVHLDRPGFTLNPTSCEQMRVESLLRSSEGKAKDASNRFQVGECASLAFKPHLHLSLNGGTRRGAHPSLRAVFRPRPGNANTSRIQVKLPHSAFLDQAHIRTICTRVQFAAGAGHGSQCPKGSIYGRVRVFTPLLDEPLSGPVILRSSNNNLPDMVVVVSGPPSLPVSFESAARIDSVRGGIRSTFTFFPDVPLSKAVLSMQGGKKGLIVNSANLCAHPQRANASFAGHNGRRHEIRPKVVASGCKKKGKAKARR